VVKLLEAAVDQGAHVADPGPTRKDFSVEFLKRHGVAHNDLRFGRNVKILLDRFNNDVRPDDVTVAMILDFSIARMEHNVARYPTNRQVAALSATFEAAKLWVHGAGRTPGGRSASYRASRCRQTHVTR